MCPMAVEPKKIFAAPLAKIFVGTEFWTVVIEMGAWNIINSAWPGQWITASMSHLLLCRHPAWRMRAPNQGAGFLLSDSKNPQIGKFPPKHGAEWNLLCLGWRKVVEGQAA